LELTLRFFNLREVLAENGIEVGALSFISTSRSGVLRRDAEDGLASGADLGISSSLNGTGDRAPGGDDSGVEYGRVNFPFSDGSRATLLFFVLVVSSANESMS
jgi:hypothetical protein